MVDDQCDWESVAFSRLVVPLLGPEAHAITSEIGPFRGSKIDLNPPIVLRYFSDDFGGRPLPPREPGLIPFRSLTCFIIFYLQEAYSNESCLSSSVFCARWMFS